MMRVMGFGTARNAQSTVTPNFKLPFHKDNDCKPFWAYFIMIRGSGDLCIAIAYCTEKFARNSSVFSSNSGFRKETYKNY